LQIHFGRKWLHGSWLRLEEPENGSPASAYARVKKRKINAGNGNQKKSTPHPQPLSPIEAERVAKEGTMKNVFFAKRTQLKIAQIISW
jgi:hypothetical protein